MRPKSTLRVAKPQFLHTFEETIAQLFCHLQEQINFLLCEEDITNVHD